jgi:DNA modification methylase
MGPSAPQRNNHPTVKPTDLMRYLCRLVTPPGGTVLDPFLGSGSTGRGAVLEGFGFIGIEREADYYAIAHKRILDAQKNPDCVSGRCYSPVACGGFGYCREKNLDLFGGAAE